MIGIFGAFGRTGRAVATQLRAAGRSVRLITRNPARAGEADAVVANLRDEGELVRALNGVQSVYALRGQRIEYGEVRLEQTLSLAPEARR